jgi:hypothetical protein
MRKGIHPFLNAAARLDEIWSGKHPLLLNLTDLNKHQNGPLDVIRKTVMADLAT